MFLLKKSMTTDPENPLLIDVLSASQTAYTYKPNEQIVDVSFRFNFENHLFSSLISYFNQM